MERDAGHRGDAHLSVGTRVAGEGAGSWDRGMRCAPACTDHRPSPRGELGQVVVIDLVAPSAQDLGPGPEPVEEQLLVALGALLEVAGAQPLAFLAPAVVDGGTHGQRSARTTRSVSLLRLAACAAVVYQYPPVRLAVAA